MRRNFTEGICKAPWGTASEDQGVGGVWSCVYQPVWTGNADDTFSGWRFPTGISGNSGVGAFRGILSEHDDCLVLCDSTGQTVGGDNSISGKTETFSVGSQKDDPESKGKLPDHTGAEGIFEKFKKKIEIILFYFFTPFIEFYKASK